MRPIWNGRHVFVLDGTTMNAPPKPEIREVFPAASNQKGTSVFPVINVAVATELSTGLVIRPELGAMYGANAVAETQLGLKVIDRLPPNSLIIADAGFGIFRTAWHIMTTGRCFLMRISPCLFSSLLNRMEKQGQTFKGDRAKITWPVTKKNLRSSPWLPSTGKIEIYLHRIQVGGKWIYLIENFGMTTKTAGDFYVQRVNVETDIESIKVRLRGEKLNGTDADVVQKELANIILHYQLMTATRMEAANQRNVHPRKLSFTEIRDCVRNFFERSLGRTKQKVRAQFRATSRLGVKCRIPDRPGRSFKRECYHKRPRCDHFPGRPILQAETPAPGKAKAS
ncbi:MAG: transposase [Planctomycetota bacterium]